MGRTIVLRVPVEVDRGILQRFDSTHNSQCRGIVHLPSSPQSRIQKMLVMQMAPCSPAVMPFVCTRLWPYDSLETVSKCDSGVESCRSMAQS